MKVQMEKFKGRVVFNFKLKMPSCDGEGNFARII